MKKFILLIVLVFATNNLFAETGKELLDACEKAMGHSKFAEFKTCKIECSLNQMGMNIGMTIYTKGKNTRMEMSMMGMEMIYVIADSTFFMLKPNFQELPFEQSAQVTGQISMVIPNITELKKDIQQPLNVELVGVEDFHGKSAKKLKIASPAPIDNSNASLSTDPMASWLADSDVFLFIDPVTNWLVGITVVDEKTDLVFDGMKRVKGYVYPSTIKIVQAGQNAEININKLEVDIDLPDSLFARE